MWYSKNGQETKEGVVQPWYSRGTLFIRIFDCVVQRWYNSGTFLGVKYDENLSPYAGRGYEAWYTNGTLLVQRGTVFFLTFRHKALPHRDLTCTTGGHAFWGEIEDRKERGGQFPPHDVPSFRGWFSG